MSIKAILYSKFDPLEGPKVVHQVPEDSVVTNFDIANSASTNSPTLLSFSTISRFLIPRQSLCGNLISITPPPTNPNASPTLILSYPVCIQSTHYPRNEFIFNFALVLSPPDSIDIPSYKSVVTKLAHLMRSLEEQSYFLSDDMSPPGTGKIYSLCEMLMEDLNNYCECMIPIDDINTLNIKLFPTLPNPAPVKAWHVPLFTVRIETLMDENWDLTMQRIIPFINGINSVKRIGELADADIKFTKKCIRHLLYYGCVLLLDIFTFNGIYAPTAEFTGMIASDLEMQAECARYVNTAFEPASHDTGLSNVGDVGSSSLRSSHLSSILGAAGGSIGFGGSAGGSGGLAAAMIDDDFWPVTERGDVMDGVDIVQLFANLKQGLTVREWYAQNANMLTNIDIRRFITFGVIKGFLYRVHRYAIQTSSITAIPPTTMTTAAATATSSTTTTATQTTATKKVMNSTKSSKPKSTGPTITTTLPRAAATATANTTSRVQGTQPRAVIKDNISIRTNNSTKKPPTIHSTMTAADDNDPRLLLLSPTSTPPPDEIQTNLIRYLDGTHSFDEICTDLCISEKDLMTRLAAPNMGEVVVVCR